ncbi:MAG: CopG family antitoxin [Pseudomonadota bacterium]
MKKKLPKLRSDKEAENFVATADLTAFDLSGFKPVQFEFAPKAARINMRLSDDLLKAIKIKAAKQGVPYQRFIRQALEKAVASKKAS